MSASPAAINGLVQGAITFPQRYPDVQIQIVESHSSDPLLAVSEDTADVILTREPQVVPKEWVFRSFMEDALINKLVARTMGSQAGLRFRWRNWGSRRG